jgi:prolipoprotein diacylglyceryltransferase
MLRDDRSNGCVAGHRPYGPASATAPATEQFREPDAGVNRFAGLTSPMLISVGMVVAGAVLAWAWRKQSRAD